MSKQDKAMLFENSPRRAFLAGFRDTFPLIVGALPFGLIYGVLVLNSGLSFPAGMAMSTFVFAGSAQFIAAGLIASNVSVFVIILTTFVVNIRHALYSATLAPCLNHLPKRWQLPMTFWLTDETFAVAAKHFYEHGDSRMFKWYYLGSALFMYSNWQLCTLIGLIAGSSIPDAANWGLDAAMPVTFTGIVVPYLRNRPMWICVIVAGAVAVVANPLPHKAGLILASLAGITAGVIAENRRKKAAANE